MLLTTDRSETSARPARIAAVAPRLRLRDDVRVDVHYRDETRYGSAISGLCDERMRRACRWVREARERHGAIALRSSSELVLERCFADAFHELYERPGTLREDCLYPDPTAVTPTTLSVTGIDTSVRAATWAIPASARGDLARWIGEFSQGARAPHDPLARSLWDALRSAGALTDAPLPEAPLADGMTFVGHASAAFQEAGARLVVDPFLLPGTAGLPDDYRPLSPAELAPDAVFITHAHPDHYDLGGLLRFGPDTPIYVPVVERESLLSPDMVARLRELGFRKVSALGWGQSVRVGPQRVTACPFYGEQPTDGAVLHPEVRNAGNVYLVESCGKRYALLADAGTDHAGRCEQVAAAALLCDGPIDVLLGGYRAWRLTPVQYLFTSVARYLLFVPRDQWGREMQIMNDADDLLDVARRWQAGVVVPYANGGAPWFWDIGLGPKLVGDTHEDPDFDPDLTHLFRAACRRGDAGHRGALSIVPLNPGDQLCFDRQQRPYRASVPGHAWPYAPV